MRASIMLHVLTAEISQLFYRIQSQPFLQDGIFYACESDNGLARVAGEQAVAFLSEYLGPNIWRGRVEQYHPRLVSLSDSKLVAIREL